MEEPLIPENEQQRIESLYEIGLLDTLPDERFDRITRLAQVYFGVPIVLISLIDKDRQWFKSKIGLEQSQAPRRISFCAHAILDDQVFCIPDAHLDMRFHDNPFVVGPPYIRFYAGMPLEAYDGSRLGTLCILDTVPRLMSASDMMVLRDLAICVEAEIELVHAHRIVRQMEFKESRMHAIIEAISEGELMVNKVGIIEKCSPLAEGTLNARAKDLIGRHVSALMSFESFRH